MSALRSASCCLRSLRRLSSLRPRPASSSPRPTSSCGGSTLTATPTRSSNHKQHEYYRVNKFRANLTPPSTAGGWTATSRGACSLHPKREFRARACPPQEEQDGAADSNLSPPCLSVCIRCCKRDADSLSEALLCFGASSASMDDLSDFDDTDEICITSIFTDDQDVHLCISTAAKRIGLEKTPSYKVTVSKQYNWINNVKDIQATNIMLNPGMAFGTGEHPTTKLCLLLLHSSVKGGENFLDYGTGSGILGIAAVKDLRTRKTIGGGHESAGLYYLTADRRLQNSQMGAALSVGIDIDPQALSSVRQNIALNEIEPMRMELYLVPGKESVADRLYLAPGKESVADQTHNRELNARKKKFDIVIANILLNPLLELAEELVSYGKPGALVGVSGIISEQIPEVEERYSEYLENISISEMHGWACLAGTKRCTL